MAYGINDLKQATLGSIIAVTLFLFLRAGNPVVFDPYKGLIIGLIWIWITSTPFVNKNKETQKHAIINIFVAVIVSGMLSYFLDLVTIEQLQSFSYFGSTAFLAAMLAVPSAQFFDKMGISNIYERWYYKGRR